MEYKTFELLTKMYIEFSEFKKDITQKVEANSNHILRLEHDLKNDVKALYDGYIQTYETLSEIKQTVDKQSVEIRVIKGGK